MVRGGQIRHLIEDRQVPIMAIHVVRENKDCRSVASLTGRYLCSKPPFTDVFTTRYPACNL